MKLKELLSKIGRDYFYLMHLSYDGQYRERLWDYAYEKKLIGLSHYAVDKNWFKIREKARKKLTRVWYRQFQEFCEKMRMGDCVLVMAGKTHLLGVGLVASPYFFNKRIGAKFFDHLRRVRWCVKYRYEDRRSFRAYFRNTLCRIEPNDRLWKLTNRELNVENRVKSPIRVSREPSIIPQRASMKEIEQAKAKLMSKEPEPEIDIEREVKLLNSQNPIRLPRELKRKAIIKVGSDSVDISAAVNLIRRDARIDIKPVYIMRDMDVSTIDRYKQDAKKFRKLISKIERMLGIKTSKFTQLCIDDTPSRDAFIVNKTILCNLLRYWERESYSFWLVTLAREFAYLIHPKRDMTHMKLMRELLVKALQKTFRP